jgi:hypothetical protein
MKILSWHYWRAHDHDEEDKCEEHNEYDDSMSEENNALEQGSSNISHKEDRKFSGEFTETDDLVYYIMSDVFMGQPLLVMDRSVMPKKPSNNNGKKQKKGFPGYITTT